MTDRERQPVRAELRAALQELSDVLLDRTNDRKRLLDAVRHAWILTELADVRNGLVPVILRNLQHDLGRKDPLDHATFALQLTRAADRL